MEPVTERMARRQAELVRQRRIREQDESRRRLRQAERELQDRPSSNLGKRLRERAARQARKMNVVLGVDLGQVRDPSAIVVTEVAARPTGEMTETRLSDGSLWREPEGESVYVVRHVERLPLRTPFRQVGRRVGDIVEALQEYAREDQKDLSLYVMADATGLGRPVVEEIREEVGTRVPVSGVSITTGEGVTGNLGSVEVRVGKSHLVSRLAALLQRGIVDLPGGPESQLLAEELRGFTVRATRRGLQAEAERTAGGHGDLAIALMLSVLFDPRLRVAVPTGRRLFR